MESAAGSGEHGGLQRWQLTIVRLAKAKESCTPNYEIYIDKFVNLDIKLDKST